MSDTDTPRTDAAVDVHVSYGVLRDFARQLERENEMFRLTLKAENDRLERNEQLERENAELRANAMIDLSSIDKLQEQVMELRAEVARKGEMYLSHECAKLRAKVTSLKADLERKTKALEEINNIMWATHMAGHPTQPGRIMAVLESVFSK